VGPEGYLPPFENLAEPEDYLPPKSDNEQEYETREYPEGPYLVSVFVDGGQTAT
jgi:hypothetical protein